MRGNRSCRPLGITSIRSIPARAGEPAAHRRPAGSNRVYPRACGGTVTLDATDSYLEGLSRACGGTSSRGLDLGQEEGLSPRVRGNPPALDECSGGNRSIPARAGEPQYDDIVHPHGEGLSPRVRGEPLQPTISAARMTVYPARAGEPLPAKSVTCCKSVYPRACGGTLLSSRHLWKNIGLSPRVRGNPYQLQPYQHGCGSIPRVRGNHILPHYRQDNGRSIPRVRGNHFQTLSEHAEMRSIPARAGEPPSRHLPGYIARVYPRACGGTITAFLHVEASTGLSPRVRGNLRKPYRHAHVNGSIPARAGEPNIHRCSARYREVYPRACGEPSRSTCHGPGVWVYPRACGGT